MTLVHDSDRRWSTLACLLLALVLPVLGNRTAVAYLNTLSSDGDPADALGIPQVESRDNKPKPTRQQLRVSPEKGSADRTAVRRGCARGALDVPCATGVGAPVRGQRSIARARSTTAVPSYMKGYESPHSELAPPG